MTDYRKLLTLTLEDAGGDRSPVSVYVGDGNTGAVETETSFLEDYLTPFWDAIRPIVTGVLVSAKVSVEYPLSAFTNNSPIAASDIEEKALFIFRPCGLNTRLVRFSLPTINEAIFTNSGAGKDVDFTNEDVIFFSLMMTQSIGEFGINAVDSHSSDLCELLFGEQAFGKG